MTVAMVLLSTVPRLSRHSCHLEWGSGCMGEVGWHRQHWTHCAFTRDLMKGHLDDYRCSAEVRGSFQKTVPKKTAENTVKHCDGGVGSVLVNHATVVSVGDDTHPPPRVLFPTPNDRTAGRV